MRFQKRYMKIGALIISDTRESFPTQHHWIVAWHPSNSITWLWVMDWIPPWRFADRSNMRFRHKLFGGFGWQTQQRMDRRQAVKR